MTQHEEFKATRANVRHASAVRAQLRAVLWAAAVASRLDGLNAQFEHLGARAGEEINLEPPPTTTRMTTWTLCEYGDMCWSAVGSRKSVVLRSVCALYSGDL